ncbi:MAG: prolyl oligopeptidase family serine peptidase [Planctomycetota bacterium]
MAARLSVPWLAALVCGLAVSLPAQTHKRPLSHDDYDGWKSLRGIAASPDGTWVAYSVDPQWGDGSLEVRRTDGSAVHRHARGGSPRFSSDGRYVVFSIAKSKVEERTKRIAELAKKGKVSASSESTETEEEPGAPTPARGRRGRGGAAGGAASRGDLGILDLATGKIEVIERIKGFRLLREVPVLVYHLDEPEAKPADAAERKDPGAANETGNEKGEEPAKTAKAGEAEVRAAPETARGPARRRGRRGAGNAAPSTANAAADADDPARRRKQGTPLVLRDLRTGTETRLDNVASYGLTKKERWLYAHVSTKPGADAKEPVAVAELGLWALSPADGSKVHVLAGIADFQSFGSNEDGTCLVFSSNKDDWSSKKPISSLYLWDGGSTAAERIVHRGSPGMPEGRVVATTGASFSKDGRVVVFGAQAPPDDEPAPILPEDKVSLDLWHWRDGMLQTQQAKRAAALRNPAWTCVYHRDDRRIVVLGNVDAPTARLITDDGSRALVLDDTPYEQLVTWDARYQDVYLVNTVDGTRTKVLEKVRNTPTTSPHGSWLLWFGTDYVWYAMDVQAQQTRALTGELGVPFHRDDDDHPHPDPAHGVAGWTTDDAEVVLYDEFDLWKVSPATGRAVCVTDGFGRANRLRLRFQRLPDGRDDDDPALPEQLWLAAADTETMAEGIFTDTLSSVGKPKKLVMVDENLGDMQKAKDADRLFFTRQTFAEFPDLWTAGLDFAQPTRLSDANPQQKDIAWGRAELVRWTSLDGRPLKGILVKPDGFDPSRKYPMLVHFYERSSQGLHRYAAPAPGTSPNAAYYVSNGYLWFMPDIYYDEGYPGESCVKCVVSGVQSLVARGFVDEKSIGAAGHSWGGYQTAFLVTRTHVFAAVESGAPVCNMISAYGGIRYSSGMSRQFQYEQTQSRIGGTPWQFPLRYWENSPIFFADKVRTPVLILHNDQDGAVPWTQGIEYFTALRRLGREAYLFNYTGEDHGLRKRQNMKDWSRRMAEYFDHHLRGRAMPKWMQEGVRYIDRDDEKLPFAASYQEAMALRQEAEASPTAAPAEAAASTSGGSK